MPVDRKKRDMYAEILVAFQNSDISNEDVLDRIESLFSEGTDDALFADLNIELESSFDDDLRSRFYVNEVKDREAFCAYISRVVLFLRTDLEYATISRFAVYVSKWRRICQSLFFGLSGPEETYQSRVDFWPFECVEDLNTAQSSAVLGLTGDSQHRY